MMDLLGAGNPYMARRFAEGGEAVPALTNEQKRANLASFQSLENHLRGIAQDQYNKQMGYAQAVRNEAERAPLSTDFGNPRKAKTAAMKAHMSAARSAGEELKENLDYIRSVRMDLLQGRRTDLSNVALPHLYSFENIVPQRVDATPAPAPSPLVPSQPQPQPQAPEQEQAVQPPAPRVPLPTEVPAPSIPGVQAPVLTPSVPVSNLTPQPMPIGGVPQPGVRTLPAYQTPTSQAQRPTEQQQPQMQIQYGPIGQAATSSSDLLKNLLAATQQSSPYDFTKNNPYLMQNEPVQFFAEGGEAQAQPAQEQQRTLTPFESAWNVLAKPQWEEALAKHREQVADYNRRYEDAVIAARNEATRIADNTIANAVKVITDERSPWVNQAQSAIRGLEALKQGKVKQVNVPDSGLWTLEYFQQGLISPESIDDEIANLRRGIASYTDPQDVRRAALVYLGGQDFDLGNTMYNITGKFFGASPDVSQLDEVQDAFRQQIASKYVGQLEQQMAMPIYDQMMEFDRANSFGVLDSVNRDLEKRTQGAVEQLMEYNRSREKELASQLGALKQSGSWSPEREQALRSAFEAEKSYLFGPQFTFSPEGYAQARGLYESALGTGWQNLPALVPTAPSVPPQQVQPQQPVAPTVPPPTSVPIPSLGQPQQPVPGVPSPAPQVPVSNLTPQPMPGITAPPLIGGVPQPSLGIFGSQSALPTYQTPQAQAPSTTQQPQTQIQYGPIGQGAVGQTNLLNTLLSNQQDPTKVSLLGFDNPYLMKPFG